MNNKSLKLGLGLRIFQFPKGFMRIPTDFLRFPTGESQAEPAPTGPPLRFPIDFTRNPIDFLRIS
jgi:hypothetical protein